MSENNADDKTLEATPKRREDYRKQGKFARARDASALATAGACMGALLASKEAMGRALDTLFERCFAHLTTRDTAIPWHEAHEALIVLAGPCAVVAAVAGVSVGLAQAGVRMYPELVAFKTERLDPFGRLKQLFSPKMGTMEALLALLRIGVIGFVTFRVGRSEFPALLELGDLPLREGVGVVTRAVTHVTLAGLVALVGLTVTDYVYSRFKLEREMRMTRKEAMDEQKAEDGDPRRKAKQRSRARAMLKKRAIKNVRQAAVVVTNPTHVAVALRYEATDHAPVVVAKGHDDLAMRIRTEARKHGVPILENRKLARALDAEVAIGHPVPAAHFVAVARVLAFVVRLRSHGTNPAHRRA